MNQSIVGNAEMRRRVDLTSSGKLRYALSDTRCDALRIARMAILRNVGRRFSASLDNNAKRVAVMRDERSTSVVRGYRAFVDA